MKRFNLYMSLLFAAMIGLSFAACSNDDGETGKGNGDGKDSTNIKKDTNPGVEIVGDSVILSAKDMSEKMFGSGVGDASLDSLRDTYMEQIKKQEQELANQKGENGIYMGFVTYTYKYWSKDAFGKPIQLSAMVSWAQYWLFGWHDLDPDNIFLMEHYTILSDAERPTNKHTTEQLALGDNLLIMPDYIGYGETKNMLHPYLNHELCAINSVDALEAGYKVFQEKKGKKTKMENEWKLYVLGASQGGGNALAVHKYLDTHPEIASKWRFDYSYCCSGPYSPRKTMDYYYNAKSLSYPVILPIVIKSMLYCYPDIMGKWKEEDFYSDAYLKIKDQMDKLIADKQTDSKALIAKLKKLLGKDEISVKDMLSASALDKSSEMTQAFYKCLDKNDLTTGWTPSHLIKLYHGKSDDIVPYSNAEAVVNAFGKDHVALFNSYWASHVTTCLKWYGTLATNNW